MSSLPKLLKHKDYITLIGTTCGLVAIFCAIIGSVRLEYGRVFLSIGFFMVVVSVGTDTLDGFVARKTGTVNQIGRELDSLSDSLTFGIAPAALMFQAFRTETYYDFVLGIGCIIFALGAILRLARFNISEDPGYTGVPTPLSALLMITFFYMNYFYAAVMGGPGIDGLVYPFPSLSKMLVPFLMIAIGWFNITTHIEFGEKGKVVYLFFIAFAPLAPILGIIGIVSQNMSAEDNFILTTIGFIFFLAVFLIELIYLCLGFFMRSKENRKSKEE
ncbi:MAG: CDP-alcohol phosphatidyltransferase family protein [Promethearchaeota archaeon]